MFKQASLVSYVERTGDGGGGDADAALIASMTAACVKGCMYHQNLETKGSLLSLLPFQKSFCARETK